ncbi:MAG: sulfatase-like hydrolase/transferase [Bacteroidota bacterium]
MHQKAHLLFLLFVSLINSKIAVAQNQPNILIIIADDMGVDVTNGYQNSDNLAVTPNLDALRQNGLTFQNAWATPQCTPTRAAMLTGKYANKTGVFSPRNNLSTDHTSIFQALSENISDAYANAVIGKWHVGQNNNLDHPAELGVQYFDGFLASNVDDYFDWTKTTNGVNSTENTYATTYLTNSALDWINQQEKPWLLWLAQGAPHSPQHTPPDDLFHTKPADSREQQYTAMIEAMDTEIGRLLNSMPEEELENTIIFFLGDNGTPSAFLQNAPRGRGKRSLYQGGLHVPLIVSGKAVTRNGEEDALVNTLDIYATVLELAGIDLEGGIHNSFSFKDLLSNESAVSSKFNFTEGFTGDSLGWAIRDNRYKLITYEDGRQQFYDLTNDPFETDDLINKLNQEQLAIKQLLEEEAQVRIDDWSCQDGILNGEEVSIDDCGTPAECTHDNSLSTTNIGCCETPEIISIYEETIEGGVRKIRTNNFPNHDYCFNQNSPNGIPAPVNYEFEVDAFPTLAANPTAVVRDNGRPARYLGVAINGVLMAPAPAQPFIFENTETGEYNWDWVFEPTTNQGQGRDLVALDCSSAHTGRQGYHYHGNMFGLAEALEEGISASMNAPEEVIQVGWASDGFPILYRFGPDENGELNLLQPSYKVREGDRTGDGISAPCGPYNGKYTRDFEYDPSIGDLDECNGIERSITLNTAKGTETFDYFYVVTDGFPQIGRCLMGTPSATFDNSNRGTPVSTDHIKTRAEYNLLLSFHEASEELLLFFTAQTEGTHFLEIFDVQGKLMSSYVFNAAYPEQEIYEHLHLYNHPAGMYFVKLSSKFGFQTKQFVR